MHLKKAPNSSIYKESRAFFTQSSAKLRILQITLKSSVKYTQRFNVKFGDFINRITLIFSVIYIYKIQQSNAEQHIDNLIRLYTHYIIRYNNCNN